MEDKVYEVTIPLEDYADLLETHFEHKQLLGDLKRIVASSRLSWDKKELTFSDERIQDLLKKYVGYDYRYSLEELKKEAEEEK